MTQVLTSSEVKKHNTKKSLWIVIKNDVYDVTAYLNEHPGGEDPLLDAAGQDATAAFEDVGHSEDARTIMKKYKIGSLAKGESCVRLRPKKWMSSTHASRKDDKKPWRTFDNTKGRNVTPRTSKRAMSPNPSQRIPPCVPPYTSNTAPKASVPKSPISRVPSVVVPRERRRRGYPCSDGRGGVCTKEPPPPSESGSNLKWAVLALAAAIIVGVAYKKYVAT